MIISEQKDQGSSWSAIAVAGSFLLIAAQERGLIMLRLPTPNNRAKLWDLGGRCVDIQARGNLIFALVQTSNGAQLLTMRLKKTELQTLQRTRLMGTPVDIVRYGGSAAPTRGKARMDRGDPGDAVRVQGPATAPASPPRDNERQQRVLRCRRQRCAHLGKHCFARCARWGRGDPDPEAAGRCFQSCREQHGIERCERACEEAAR